MKQSIKLIAFASLTLAMMSNVLAYSGESYAKDAKISIDEARKIALKAFPGTVVEEELEHKTGGSGLRFSFDIRSAKHVTHEVGIDAKDGKVLQNSKDNDE
ncbi:MAG: hypothetical protein B7Z60_00700 [Ferrovum sp. 37-45-19]|jgi:uncharacterized membrane protein YkoI|uniref:PepSY domain-containing protein n=2 Tax=Ferrovum sp. JA12 TaxID=1356299 RepID=UPI000703959E|nr:PepSY domain-containing protein [Ferrovum sp. JA12]OYV79875.1 MAG: hypothetical protein B7Z65_03990 [Ferrovum sp. 21-44-67]OYV95500.1 MAG: hypothetical protein B7Z60_00700 [Ferrovum sp. 37-45-19]OZB31544.1 MAG: hypothetical protein B7X47_09890 [Ferrovum sp. 34-44-207]HQT81297.1 PepSY domain-containing protein [Ferrovaceae bacterium]KRH78185.1 peptidase propeptide and YPEB domain protein [Ferrovum sp. JA12]